MAGNFEGIKNRRFGIEIEMTGITRCSAAKAIRDVLGGSVEHIGGSYDKYKIYDEDGRAWSIVSDASIEPYKKNGDRASDLYKVEMNSPVLEYEDIPLLQEVIRGLRKAGAIAMWRLQNYEIFGGTWLSDYVPNKLGGFIEESSEMMKNKPKCALIGEDGNIFNLMGIASRTLKDNGMKAEAMLLYSMVGL